MQTLHPRKLFAQYQAGRKQLAARLCTSLHVALHAGRKHLPFVRRVAALQYLQRVLPQPELLAAQLELPATYCQAVYR